MRVADLLAWVGTFLAAMALTLALAGAAQPLVKPAPAPAPTATRGPAPKPGASVAMPGSPGADAADATDKPQFPTTQFAPNARTASVSDGDMTATITMVRRADLDPDADVPLLQVFVGGKKVIEAAGIDSDSDEPAAEASIVEMDASNQHKEVYFSSYSGGCCSTVIVAEEVSTIGSRSPSATSTATVATSRISTATASARSPRSTSTSSTGSIARPAARRRA